MCVLLWPQDADDFAKVSPDQVGEIAENPECGRVDLTDLELGVNQVDPQWGLGEQRLKMAGALPLRLGGDVNAAALHVEGTFT